MGKYNGAVVTTAGEGVIAQALRGTKLTWTKMRTSSVAVSASSIKGLTALTGVEQTANITNASVYSNSIVQVSARFSNTGIATAYLIRTVGIYGQLAGGSETLIAVMTAVTPDEMPVYDADAPSAFIFTNHLVVQDAASITMDVNDTGTATVADLELKVDKAGGDVSNTVAATATASSAAYPIPAAGDSIKVILGKIRKFFTDIKAAYTNVSVSGRKITFTTAAGGTKEITTQDTTYGLASTSANGLLRQLTGNTSQWMRGDGTWQYLALQNNSTTTAEHYALDARMGKTLNDRINKIGTIYSQVNSTTQTTTANTWKNLVSVTVPAGNYCCFGRASASTNQKGKGFAVSFSESDMTNNIYLYANMEITGAVSDILNFSQQTTLYVRVFTAEAVTFSSARISLVRVYSA